VKRVSGGTGVIRSARKSIQTRFSTESITPSRVLLRSRLMEWAKATKLVSSKTYRHISEQSIIFFTSFLKKIPYHRPLAHAPTAESRRRKAVKQHLLLSAFCLLLSPW